MWDTTVDTLVNDKQAEETGNMLHVVLFLSSQNMVLGFTASLHFTYMINPYFKCTLFYGAPF